MRKKLALLSLILFSFTAAHTQDLKPLKWNWKAVETAKGEYNLVFTASIEKGWHTYSQYIGEGGPVPTSFTFDSTNKSVTLIGKTTEKSPKTTEGHDPVFDMQLKYFEESLVCERKVKVLKSTKLRGTLAVMAWRWHQMSGPRRY